MKILFLDIDGVCNSAKTLQRQGGTSFIGIDPFMALLVNRICEATGAQIVLSSSWRLWEDTRNEVKKIIYPQYIDVTPDKRGLACRGCEVKEWLEQHPEVKRYAILDDSRDFHNDHKPNFFNTSWEEGLTEEIAQKVIEHFTKL